MSGVTTHYTGKMVKTQEELESAVDSVLTEMFTTRTTLDSSDLSHVQIQFLDTCDDPDKKEYGYPVLRHLEDQRMVQMGSIGTFHLGS